MCDRQRRYVPLAVLFSLSSFAVFPAAAAAAAASSSSSPNTDFQTLLCLKLHLSNPAGLLGSWKQKDSLSFCRWPGVTCSKTSTSRVVALDLESSGLNGQIPPCIANLTHLTRIHFPDNQLSGQIPLELGQLSRLSYLNLSSNSFSGSIPNTMSSTYLQVIDLGSNKLSGAIPEELGMLHNLSVLDLARNSLTGNIPLSLGSSSSLVSLVLANNTLTGPIPSALANSSSLQVLNLVKNNLGGDIPPALFNSTSLQRLNLGWNNFTGSIPDVSNLNLPLQYLTLSVNGLAGTIPSSLGNLSSLRLLRLAANHFWGIIPVSISKIPDLQVLDISYNNFQGTVPPSIYNISSLMYLSLAVNQFTDAIPFDIGYTLPSIQKLVLQQNNFQGKIPPSLANATNLESINLGANAFHEGFDLSHNQLSGQIPQEIGGLINIGPLIFSSNHLSGHIPSTLGACVRLEYLHLEGNFLDGRIPESFINLKGIAEIDLSRNNLSGEIPNFFQSFNSLNLLNLSFNNFEGQMPGGGIFQNSNEWRKRSKRSDNPSFMEMKNFSYADLVKATNGFSSDNLVGSGTYGLVYKGVLESEASGIVAIKVFKLDELGAPKSFVVECEAFRNTRHRNLVRVISACSTWDYKGNDFKALIIEYMANGTLESWIHSEMRRPLSLGSRVTIAVDIAAALDYLHNRCMPPIVHCDLKPSNVLLDDVMGARLSDFGLAKFLQSHNSSSISISTSLAGPRGSIGYIAPEYGTGSKISTDGDVYSYGIVILEMLTGKRPTDELFNNGLNLQKFVRNAFPQKIREILDPNIIPNFGSEGGDNNLDHENQAIKGMLSCIMQLVKLGLSCSMQTPKDRPTMLDVYTEVSTINRTFSALATMC
ncbi:putative LRR receptor-like serine/threonine-protein kinase [Dichanthelium oligosanthes]|uniref:Receptor kinase-like protein Xa21 n=1 Tax=Dichanthelium oligosanthes TaxID=888268 RepID=A0A1E5UTF1_9POAL|nr:putative LRR receptor-like serine/threonine-protein kinase [Dichanthelium oligosanthes]